jgi:hypothetical protein
VTLVSTKQRVRGTFVARVGDSIDVQTTSPDAGAPMRIALQGIRRIDVFAGRRHPVGKSILLGTGIGAAAGALIGAAAPLCEPSGGWFDCLLEPTTRSESVGIYAISLGLGGLLTGAVVGAIGHDAWTPASLSGWHPIVGVRRSGVTIGLTRQLRR